MITTNQLFTGSNIAIEAGANVRRRRRTAPMQSHTNSGTHPNRAAMRKHCGFVCAFVCMCVCALGGGGACVHACVRACACACACACARGFAR
eukprot:3720503-Pyramimonas_sp.AAC.1